MNAAEAKLARKVLAAMRPKQAAAWSVRERAYEMTRAHLETINAGLVKIQLQAAKLMARQKFQMDLRQSWLTFKVDGGDGLYIEGALYFKDLAETYRDETEGSKIFQAVLDTDAQKVYGKWDEWVVHFGK